MKYFGCPIEADLNTYLVEQDKAEARWDSYIYDIELYTGGLTEFEYQKCIEHYENDWDASSGEMSDRIENFREFSELLRKRVPCHLTDEKVWDDFCEGDYEVDLTYCVDYHYERAGLYSSLNYDYTNPEIPKLIIPFREKVVSFIKKKVIRPVKSLNYKVHHQFRNMFRELTSKNEPRKPHQTERIAA